MAQRDAPGASVAKVAMSQGINANIMHHWRKLARESDAAAALPRGFVPVALEPKILNVSSVPVLVVGVHRQFAMNCCQRFGEDVITSIDRGLLALTET